MVEKREYNATLRRRILESFFDVEIQGTNSPIVAGESLDVDTKVSETGGLDDSQDITLDIDGVKEVDVENVSINADGTKTITLKWNTETDEDGSYTGVTSSEDDSDTFSFTVETLEPFFNVEIQGTNSPIKAGENLEVDTKVLETNGQNGTQDITLDIDGIGQEDIQNVSLNADGTATITLSWSTETDEDGDYTAITASEDDSDTVSITVELCEYTVPENDAVNFSEESTYTPSESDAVNFSAGCEQ